MIDIFNNFFRGKRILVRDILDSRVLGFLFGFTNLEPMS